MSVFARPVLNELQTRIMEWFICDQHREPIPIGLIRRHFLDETLPALDAALETLTEKELLEVEKDGFDTAFYSITTPGEICLMDLAPDIGHKLQDALDEAIWKSRLPKDDPDYLSLKEHLLERVKQILDEEQEEG